MNSEHVAHLQRMANESWRGSPEHAALTAAIAALSAPKLDGEVVVTRDESGVIVAVTRQDAEGRILSVIAEAAPPSAPVGVEGVRRYLAARDAKPIRGMDPDVIHAIHTGTEWEAELCMSDLRALVQQPASDGGFTAADMMDARQEGREEAQQPAAVDGVEQLTEQQAVIVTGYTGVLCSSIDAFHTDLEKRAGRSVFTHEMANFDWIKPLYRDDFIALAGQQGGAK